MMRSVGESLVSVISYIANKNKHFVHGQIYLYLLDHLLCSNHEVFILGADIEHASCEMLVVV